MATTKKTTTKASAAKSTSKKAAPKHIGIVANDPWLEPYEDAIRGRHDHAVWMENELTNKGKMSLSDFVMSTMVCIAMTRESGYSVNGHLTLLQSILSAISMIGRKTRSLQQSVLRTLATGN